MKKIIHKTKKAFKDFKNKVDNIKSEEEKKNNNGYIHSHVDQDKEEVVHKLEISTLSVIKATFAIFGIWLLFQLIFDIKDILILIFISFFIAAALDPIAAKFQRFKIPRGISVILIYLSFLGIFTFAITQIVPVMAEQVTSLSADLKSNVENLLKNDSGFLKSFKPQIESLLNNIEQEDIFNNLEVGLKNFGKYLEAIAGNTSKAFVGIFSGIANVVLVLVLAFFIVIDEKGLSRFFLSILPKKYRHYASLKAKAISQKIGLWLNGQVILCFFVGFGIFVGLSILGINNALALAFFAGLMELIPYLGVIFAFIPAALVAANQTVWHFIGVIAVFVIVQQLEGNVLVPIVMKRVTGLSPVATIIAVMVGARLMSSLGSSAILGIILAVPVTTILDLFVKEYLNRNLPNSETK